MIFNLILLKKGCDNMLKKEVTVQEFEKLVNALDNIEEPIIIKRENKNDLVIISFEEYKKKLFLAELERKIEEGEEDIKNNRVYNARAVFEELEEKYGY